MESCKVVGILCILRTVSLMCASHDDEICINQYAGLPSYPTRDLALNVKKELSDVTIKAWKSQMSVGTPNTN